ncbi:hypothetical protein D1007_59542 [Hordeum vulgare]|nr:hypothetical protein D1007_59542 [Hordeum vulgare]
MGRCKANRRQAKEEHSHGKEVVLLRFIVQGNTGGGQRKGRDKLIGVTISCNAGKSYGESLSASAAEFHPSILLNNMHDEFIHAISSGQNHVAPANDQESSPNANDVVLSMLANEHMSVHMEYCSEQVREFEMVDSDGDEEIVLPEMQCFPKDLACALGSAKRSLLDTLKKVECDKKMKTQEENPVKWRPTLSSRPTTRNHGNINIMDKAKGYLQKNNLEIPKSFKDIHVSPSLVNNTYPPRPGALLILGEIA